MKVHARTFKEVDLEGGTLLVSVPHVGVAGAILTDYVLEQLQMDQVACLDSPAFPPFVMVHRGKPRLPVRIHADPKTRVAVLRSEINPLPPWTRPLAVAALGWARQRGMARVIVPDGILVPPPKAKTARAEKRVWFVAVQAPTRVQALAENLKEFDQGVLGGVPAMLLIEGRFASADVLALLGEFHDPLTGAGAAVSLGRILPKFVPGLQLDLTSLQETANQTERVVRALRDEAEQVAHQLLQRSEFRIPMMYA